MRQAQKKVAVNIAKPRVTLLRRHLPFFRLSARLFDIPPGHVVRYTLRVFPASVFADEQPNSASTRSSGFALRECFFFGFARLNF
jgi:hypothetical protein